MSTVNRKYNHAYFFPILLLSSIIAGTATGYWLGHAAMHLKPLGDVFLNLMFTAVVPLIFFSIASAIAQLGESKQLLKVIFNMLLVFLFTGLVASFVMLIAVLIFPPAKDVLMHLNLPATMHNVSLAEEFVNIFSVTEFTRLLSHKSMLPLIFFSILVGLATSFSGEVAKPFKAFLQSGAEVFMRLITFIMYYAPIGFFAFFAVLVGELGPKLLESYFRVLILYYTCALLYFLCASTFYAYLANKLDGVKAFWKHIFLPMITALATCSSAASIPVNLQAAKKIGVPKNIYETVIPLGAVLHKDGTTMGGIIKIAFLFGIFHMSFSGPTVLLTAIGVALLVGIVMGAIPSGGMLGEMLILSVYGFPPQALIIIAAISLIIDPLATMVNVTNNTATSMMVARLVEKRRPISATSKAPTLENISS